MNLTEKYIGEGKDEKLIKVIEDGMKAINTITKNVPMTQKDRKDIFGRAFQFLAQKKKEKSS